MKTAALSFYLIVVLLFPAKSDAQVPDWDDGPVTLQGVDIQYSIPVEGRVVLKLYSILGSEVAILVDEVKSEGRYDVRVDASGLSSGVYLYKLQAAGQTATRKMLVVK
jgi:hypothetical protein